MARPKAFVEEQALDAAIDVFREHGFEGTSAELLVRALRIGRQSLYDTFGDKWQIYLASVRRDAGSCSCTAKRPGCHRWHPGHDRSRGCRCCPELPGRQLHLRVRAWPPG